MFVCSCRAVTDRTVRAVVAAGARTPQEIAARCGAGTECGGCWAALHELVQETVGRVHSAA